VIVITTTERTKKYSWKLKTSRVEPPWGKMTADVDGCFMTPGFFFPIFHFFKSPAVRRGRKKKLCFVKGKEFFFFFFLFVEGGDRSPTISKHITGRVQITGLSLSLFLPLYCCPLHRHSQHKDTREHQQEIFPTFQSIWACEMVLFPPPLNMVVIKDFSEWHASWRSSSDVTLNVQQPFFSF